jgi:hypothetical protein
MGVNIDEPQGHHQAGGVNGSSRFGAAQIAHGYHAIMGDAHIAGKTRLARAVGDESSLDQEIKHLPSLSEFQNPPSLETASGFLTRPSS